MRTPLSLSSIAATAMTLVATTVMGASPSPSVAPVAGASPGTAVVSAPPVVVETIGPLAWERTSKGKGLLGDAHVADLVQLGDGASFLCGYTADQLQGVAASLWASDDAVKWTPVKWKAPRDSQCAGLAVWSGGLIAVGRGAEGGVLWTSDAGRKWARATIDGSASLNDVGTLADQLVVIGDVATATGTAPVLWTSIDGTTWEAHPIAADGSARHLAISPDGGFVVAGKLPGPMGGTPTVWHSADGLTWAQADLGLEGDGPWFLPAFRLTPAGYVLSLTRFDEDNAVVGAVWSSPDGATWQQTVPPTTGSFSAVGTLGTEAMLIGPGGTWRSSDGTTWVANPEPTFEGYDILAGFIRLADGRWLAGGDTFDGPKPGIATWIGTDAPAG